MLAGNSFNLGLNDRSEGVDLFKKDVVEPASVKEQMIESATECVCMLLRIDDVIAGSKASAPPGRMPGM